MAWELTWPLSIADLAAVLLFHGLLDVQGETADSAWALIAFFLVSPWVVRRALRKSYEGCKVSVQRPVEDRNGQVATLKYQESLKVMWLLAWRTLILALGTLLITSLALKAAGLPSFHYVSRGPLPDNLGLSAVDTISNLLFAPLLIPGMLRKRYRGFRLELDPLKRDRTAPDRPK